MSDDQPNTPVAESSLGSVIYMIRCLPTGKFYIGSAVNLQKRWRIHHHHLKRGCHHSHHLQHAWDKHGGEAFELTVIELVADAANLIEREQWHLDQTRCYDRKIGFNVSPTAGSSLGILRSEDTRAKLSAMNRGRKRTPESIAMTAEAHRGMKRSSETRLKMSAAQQGRTFSPEAIAKMSKTRRGKKHSPEHKAKISAAGKGRIFTPEHRAKMAAAARGRKMSPESIAKIAAAKRGMKLTPEARARMSAGQCARRKRERKSKLVQLPLFPD
jgi:group I intron endonuclease